MASPHAFHAAFDALSIEKLHMVYIARNISAYSTLRQYKGRSDSNFLFPVVCDHGSLILTLTPPFMKKL